MYLENYFKKTYPSSELFRREFLVLMNLSITNPLLEKSFNDISASWKYVWWNLTVLINVSTTILCLQNLLKDVTPRLDKYSDVYTYPSKITTRADESFYDNPSSWEVILQRFFVNQFLLKCTSPLDTSFHDIFSSWEIFQRKSNREESSSEHISRRGNIIEFFEEYSSSWYIFLRHLLVLQNLSKIITMESSGNMFQDEEISSKNL